MNLDAEARGLGREQRRRSGAALAEMEIITHRDAADAEPADQIVVNEILRAGAGARAVEGHHHGAVEAGAGEQPQLRGLVGQPELRRMRAEEAARMRLERHGKRRRPSLRHVMRAITRGGRDGRRRSCERHTRPCRSCLRGSSRRRKNVVLSWDHLSIVRGRGTVTPAGPRSQDNGAFEKTSIGPINGFF